MSNLLRPAWPLAVTLFSTSFSLAEPDWLKKIAQEASCESTFAETEAVLLDYFAEVSIGAGGRAATQVRLAWHLLDPTQKSFELFSEYTSSFRKLENFKGWVISPEGSSTQLSKANLIELHPERGYTTYEDGRLMMVAISDLTAGTVIGVEYSIRTEGWYSFFHNFMLPSRYPVTYAQITVTVPEGWGINYAEWRERCFIHEQQGNRHIWTAQALASLPTEPLMPKRNAGAPRLAVSCYDSQRRTALQFRDWPEVANWAGRLFDAPARPDDQVKAFVERLTAGLGTPEEKLRAIAGFVRDEIRFVGIEIGEWRWQPRSASVTLLQRFGDCKDKTTLMRAMLQAVGISSCAVLTNMNGTIQPGLPTPFQFDHCLIAVALANLCYPASMSDAIVDEWLFFDPTDPATDLGDLPAALQGSSVLLARPKETLRHRLPYRSSRYHRRRYQVKAHLAAGGSFSAKVRITDFDSWAAETRHTWKTTSEKDRLEKWRAQLSRNIPAVNLSNFISGAQADSVWVAFEIKSNYYAVQAGEFNLLKLDFFEIEKTPELSNGRRRHPIYFGPTKRIETDVVWYLPRGWAMPGKAVANASACGAAQLAYQLDQNDETLRFHSVVENSAEELPPSEYEAALSYCRDLNRLHGLVVTLKKSAPELAVITRQSGVRGAP